MVVANRKLAPNPYEQTMFVGFPPDNGASKHPQRAANFMCHFE